MDLRPKTVIFLTERSKLFDFYKAVFFILLARIIARIITPTTPTLLVHLQVSYFVSELSVFRDRPIPSRCKRVLRFLVCPIPHTFFDFFTSFILRRVLTQRLQ